MKPWTRLVVAATVAITLAAPDIAGAQAARRGSSTSSGGGEQSGASSAGPRSSPGGSQSGSAQPRSGSAPGGSSGASQGAAAGSTRSTPGGSGAQAGPRNRGVRPSQGEAQARIYGRRGVPVSRPGYVVRSSYPWYGGSFGFYDPWSYGFGFNRWNRYPYGVGYGVFGDPFGFYDPYLPYGYAGSGYRRATRDDRDDDRATGAIRLRASPAHARVYVDGALVGTVDDFNGLTGHLRLEAGVHQIELRAQGYETFSADVTVQPGRTMTERATLRRIGN